MSLFKSPRKEVPTLEPVDQPHISQDCQGCGLTQILDDVVSQAKGLRPLVKSAPSLDSRYCMGFFGFSFSGCILA